MKSILDVIPSSVFAASSPPARLWCDISARITKIRAQLEIDPARLPAGVRIRAAQHIRSLEKMLARLDLINIVTQPQAHCPIRREFEQLGPVDDHLAAVFGDFILRKRGKNGGDPVLSAFFRRLRDGVAVSRVQQLRYRFIAELQARVSQGWFVIFDTLTVRPADYDEVFAPGSLCFNRYIQRFRRAAGVGVDGHSYFAVVERGADTGRLHIHVVHSVRRLPAAVTDPNAGAVVPAARVLQALKLLWPHGRSLPIACRFGPSDAYARLGWRWPVEVVGRRCRPIVAGHPVPFALYLSKYLVKSYNCGGDHPWRTRLSRNLGMSQIDQVLSRMTNQTLMTLLTGLMSTRNLTLSGQKVPLPLLRARIQNRLLRSWKSKRIRRSRTISTIKAYKRRPSFVKLCVSLIQRIPPPSLQSLCTMRIRKSTSTVISDLVRAFADCSVPVPSVMLAGPVRVAL